MNQPAPPQNYQGYQGELLNGTPHGKGSAMLAPGLRYAGDFRNGLIDGFGTLKYNDGRMYKGCFKQGKRHGRGRLIYPNGDEEAQVYNFGKLQDHGARSARGRSSNYNRNYLKEVYPVNVESRIASTAELVRHTQLFNFRERRRKSVNRGKGLFTERRATTPVLLTGKDKAMNEFINKQKGSNYFRTDRVEGNGFGNCGMNRAAIFQNAR